MPVTRRYVRRRIAQHATDTAVTPAAEVTTSMPPGRPASGEYYTVANGGTQTTSTITLGEVRFQLLAVPVESVITGLAIHITSLGSGGTTPRFRLGLYADDGTGTRPTGSPIAGTEVSLDPTAGSTGDRDVAFSSPVTLEPGYYWAAAMLVSGSAMGGNPTIVVPFVNIHIGLATLGNNTHRSWAQSAASNASALPAIGTIYRVGAPPLVGAKVQ